MNMIPELTQALLLSNNDLSVGRFTYGSPQIVRYKSAVDRIEIGSFCSIAREVVFIMGGEHYTNFTTTYPMNLAFPGKGLPWHEKTKGPTRVGSDVWIGYGATILSGVTIGHGAVIGARSVVTSDINPYQIVAGNPARVIRNRFSQSVISHLLQNPWWDLPIDEIGKIANRLMAEP